MSEISPKILKAPSLESPFSKYLREYRLLNSLLISLFAVVCLFALLWNIVVWVDTGDSQGADFSDAGKSNAAPQKQEHKVRLMQRQKQAKPTKTHTFRAIAVSDISVPMVDIEAKDLNPAMALSPMGDVGDVRVDVDMSVLNKAFASNFMGVKSQANKILFIIDYSASMRVGIKSCDMNSVKRSISFQQSVQSLYFSFLVQHGLRVRMQTLCIKIGKEPMVVDGNLRQGIPPSVQSGYPSLLRTKKS
jgi:hypothetical protein